MTDTAPVVERASEQALTDCIITYPRSTFDRVHNAAIRELLDLRQALALAGPALESAAVEFDQRAWSSEQQDYFNAAAGWKRDAATLRSLTKLGGP